MKRGQLYELRNGGTFLVSVAEPTYPNRTPIIRTATRTYALEMPRWTRLEGVIRDVKRDLVVARFFAQAFRGELRFATGSPLIFMKPGRITWDWVFASADGEELMRYSTRRIRDRPGAVGAARILVRFSPHMAIAMAILFFAARRMEAGASTVAGV